MSETIEKTTVQSNQQIWKMELEELRKQKSNKSLPAPVHKLCPNYQLMGQKST